MFRNRAIMRFLTSFTALRCASDTRPVRSTEDSKRASASSTCAASVSMCAFASPMLGSSGDTRAASIRACCALFSQYMGACISLTGISTVPRVLSASPIWANVSGISRWICSSLIPWVCAIRRRSAASTNTPRGAFAASATWLTSCAHPSGLRAATGALAAAACNCRSARSATSALALALVRFISSASTAFSMALSALIPPTRTPGTGDGSAATMRASPLVPAKAARNSLYFTVAMPSSVVSDGSASATSIPASLAALDSSLTGTLTSSGIAALASLAAAAASTSLPSAGVAGVAGAAGAAGAAGVAGAAWSNVSTGPTAGVAAGAAAGADARAARSCSTSARSSGVMLASSTSLGGYPECSASALSNVSTGPTRRALRSAMRCWSSCALARSSSAVIRAASRAGVGGRILPTARAAPPTAWMPAVDTPAVATVATAVATVAAARVFQ